MRWLSRLLRRDRLERELDKELQHHVAEEARRLKGSGAAVDPAEARRLALASFGGLEPAREMARDARGTRWLEDFVRDVRYSLRLMRRSPVFTIAAIASLAVGIGANTAIFSVIHALVLQPLPVSHPGELFFLNRAGLEPQNLRFSHPRIRDFAREVSEARFGGVSSLVRMQVTFDESAELAIGQLASGDWFGTLGLTAQTGRLMTLADDQGAGNPVVVLSDAYWTRRFGRDPAVVGKTLTVNGAPLAIIGVTPPGFSGVTVGERADFWAPTVLQPRVRYFGNASIDDADGRKPWAEQYGVQWLTVVVRIPAASRSAVQEKAGALFRHALEESVKSLPADRRQYRLREHLEFRSGERGVSPLRDFFSAALQVMMTTVAVVLLIACANLANLLIARNAARAREITLRLAIGARRGRLVRQLVTESCVLAAAGGLAGLAVGWWGSHALLRLASSSSAPVPLDISMNATVLAFSAGVSLVTGLLFGLAPALRSARTDLQGVLRGARGVMGGSQRFGKGLVVVQVSLALMLLIAATLFVQTFRNYLRLDTGFERERVVSARVDPRLAGFTEDQLPALQERLLAEAGRLPGVRSASLAMSGAATGSQRISSIVAEGYQQRPDEEASVQEDFVGPRYFETLAMPLKQGRDFTDRDDARAPRVAILSEAMVARYFKDKNPIGKHFGYSSDRLEFEVVGVVADARVNGLRESAPAMAYYPLRQHGDEYFRNVYVRATGDPTALRDGLRRSVIAAAPTVAVREVVTLAELTERTVGRERLISRLVGAFSLLAVALACLGLYGTVSYSVAQRTNEIGVRLAMGATPGRVRWLVLRESCGLVALGCLAGLVAMLVLVKYVSALVFGLSPRDPLTLAAATGTVLLVGVLAALVPAWRASRVDPLLALR